MIAKTEKIGAQVEAVSMSRSISMGRKPCTRNSFQNGKRLKLRLWRRLAGKTKGDKTQPEGTHVFIFRTRLKVMGGHEAHPILSIQSRGRSGSPSPPSGPYPARMKVRGVYPITKQCSAMIDNLNQQLSNRFPLGGEEGTLVLIPAQVRLFPYLSG